MDNENQQPDGVWVNRAEYDRLKRAETERLYPTPKPIGSEPFVNGQFEVVEAVAKNTKAEKVKLVVVGVLAVLSFIYPMFIIFFIITGIAVMATTTKKDNSQKSPTPVASRVVKVVLIVALTPFIGIAVLFAYLMVLAGSGRSA